MPAVSKDQQRAAGIALKAKREGKIDELPNGAAKEMANSMSQKELEKYASTKHKGLPEKKKKNESFAGVSLAEMMNEALPAPYDSHSGVPSGYVPDEDKEEREETSSKYRTPEPMEEGALQEEMVDVEEGDEITTQKPKKDRVKEKGTKKKSAKDSWTSAVNAVASHSRHPLTTNTAGARVAETIEARRWQKLAGIIKENNIHEGMGNWLQHMLGVEGSTGRWLTDKIINWAKSGKLWNKIGVDRQGVTIIGLEDLVKKAGNLAAGDLHEEGRIDHETFARLMREGGVFSTEEYKEWLDAADVSPVKLDYIILKRRDLDEAMIGGISNSTPNPGHKAKMNECGDDEKEEEQEDENDLGLLFMGDY